MNFILKLIRDYKHRKALAAFERRFPGTAPKGKAPF